MAGFGALRRGGEFHREREWRFPEVGRTRKILRGLRGLARMEYGHKKHKKRKSPQPVILSGAKNPE